MMMRSTLRKLGIASIFLIALHCFSFWFATLYERIDRGPATNTPAEGFWPRYGAYLHGLQRGDWGNVQGVPIGEYLGPIFQRSLILLGLALLCTVLIGPLLGVSAISRRTSRIAPQAYSVLAIGSSLPGFFLGSLLIAGLIYLSRSGWYSGPGTLIPVQGTGIDSHLILPVFTLAARPTLYIGYIMAGLLEHELQQEYIRVARSKGLGWRDLLVRHALPNIAASSIASLHRALRLLVGGLILVEALFDWRGVGYLLLSSLRRTADSSMSGLELQPELFACLALLFGGLLLLADVIASLMIYRADPRIRVAVAQPFGG